MKKLIASLVCSLFLLAASAPAFAQTLPLPSSAGGGSVAETIGIPDIEIQNSDRTTNDDLIRSLTLNDGFLNRAIKLIKYALIGVFIVYFTFYAFSLITSRGQEDAISEFGRAVTFAVLGFLFIAVAEPLAYTFQLGQLDQTAAEAAAAGNFITNPAELIKTAQFTGFSLRAAVTLMQYLLGTVALLAMAIAIFRLITGGGEEDSLTNARKVLISGASGLVVVASSGFIIDLIAAPLPAQQNIDLPRIDLVLETMATQSNFSTAEIKSVREAQAKIRSISVSFIAQVANRNIPLSAQEPLRAEAVRQATAELAQLSPRVQYDYLLTANRLFVRIAVVNYVKYFQTFMMAAAIAMLIYAGARMVLAGGNDDAVSSARKMILWVFGGLALILFSEVIVNIFFPQNGISITVPGAREFKTFAAQVGGITNFILTFTGVVSVLSLIYGAVMLNATAVSGEAMDTAKKIILASALGIVLTLSAYALVNTVLSGTAANPGTAINLQLR